MTTRKAVPRSAWLRTSRLRTHALTAGTGGGTPVLLIHGNVSSARFFGGLIPELAAGRRVIAPDLRGFGGSQTLPVDATRGLGDFADDLYSLTGSLAAVTGSLAAELAGSPEPGLAGPGERAGLAGPVHLIGWSMGGGVAMRYAIDHPDRVASLTLLAPMSPFGAGGTRDAAGTPCWPDHAGSGGGAANPELVRRLLAGDTGDESPLSPRSVLRSVYVAPGHRMAAAAEDEFVAGMLAMATGDENYPGTTRPSPNWPHFAPGELGVLNAISPRYCDLGGFADIDPRPDVLWIRGDADQIVSDTSTSEPGYLGQLGVLPGWPGPGQYPPQPMVSQIRGVLTRYAAGGGHYREEVLPGCGHSPHLERPDEVAAMIGEFLEGR